MREALRKISEIFEPNTKRVNFKGEFLAELQKYPVGTILPKVLDFGKALGGKIRVDAWLEVRGIQTVMVLKNVPGWNENMVIYLNE